MSGAVTVIVTGDDLVAANIGQLNRRSNDLSDAMRMVGDRVVSDARRYAPRLSGALAGSVHLDVRRKSVSAVSSLVYSGVQNYGWQRHGIEATYFMNRAADDKGDLAASRIADQIKRIIGALGLD